MFKCNKNHEKCFKKYLIKRFANTYNFCDWEKFDETKLPTKRNFIIAQ